MKQEKQTTEKTSTEFFKLIIDQHPATFERNLIMALINCHPFYLAVKDRLCPWNKELANRRYDFSINHYSKLYEAIAFYWDGFGDRVSTEKMPQEHLRNMIIGWSNEGKIHTAAAQSILTEIDEDFYTTPMSEEFITKSVGGHVFDYWLGRRMDKQVIQEITNRAKLEHMTCADVKDLIEKFKHEPTVTSGRKLSELVRPVGDDPDELLRYRYLCRGGALLLAGPTGVGKSSWAMQCMVLWALLLVAFGIKPARALKSLLIQAENDDGDLAEMRDGVIRGLNLSPEDGKRACENIVVVREDSRTGASFGAEVVGPLLEKHKPDLLWIDPALSFLGGESNSQKDVGGFLRNILNPLLHKHHCGCVVVHHTNKPAKGQEKPNWSGGDYAYLGAGSAEWANWARAVLALRSVGSHEVFQLVAAKRGSRLGWKEADDTTTAYAKTIAHAKEPGVIYWREATDSELPQGGTGKRVFTKEDVLDFVPLDKPIAKAVLREKAQEMGVQINKINGLIDELVEDGTIYLWKRKRPGTNPASLYARFPQPTGEVLK